MKKDISTANAHNFYDYDQLVNQFSWQEEQSHLEGLPDNRGLNIAHEAIVRHAKGELKDTIALRCKKKISRSKILLTCNWMN